MKKVLLGTTCLIAAGAIAGSAMAQEISLGRTMDLRISGTTDFEVEYAEDGVTDNRPDNREVFFNQDQEIVFLFSGVGDATGIRYLANLEMDLGSDDNVTWDEAWISLRGGFGDFRFGNEDSVVDILKIGGHINNRGTGGLDGAQVTVRSVRPADSGEATKIIYYTPMVAGFQGGISYAVNGDDSGNSFGTVDDTQDHLELGANWLGDIGGVGLGAFVGYTTFNPEEAAADGDRTHNFMVGGEVELAGVSFAAGYIDNDDGAEIDYTINLGIGTEIGGVGLSFAYDHTEANETGDEDSNYYVVSADTPILPGVALRGDLGYFDGDEDGVNGVVQLRVAY